MASRAQKLTGPSQELMKNMLLGYAITCKQKSICIWDQGPVIPGHDFKTELSGEQGFKHVPGFKQNVLGLKITPPVLNTRSMLAKQIPGS